MKEVIEQLKEWWKVPRYRSLIKLFGWLLFLVIVISMVQGGGTITEVVTETNNTEKDDTVDIGETINSYSVMDNYEVSVNITDNTKNISNLTGTYYNNKLYFTYNMVNYYYSDNNLYRIDNDKKELYLLNSFDIPISILLHDNIYNLIISGNKEYETKYSNGNTSSKYTINNSNIDRLYSIESIITNSSNNIINTIDMDIVSNTISHITIYYKNINSINDYTVNYDNYNLVENINNNGNLNLSN